jgi:hypothetical protein
VPVDFEELELLDDRELPELPDGREVPELPELLGFE